MKSISKTIVYLRMSALLFVVALAPSQAGEKPLPFRGTIEANEVFTIIVPPFQHFVITGSGTGTATRLGRFTVTYEWDADFTTTTIPTGVAEFIAANGDRLYTEAVNTFNSPTDDPTVFLLAETHTITGGTGRFSGATGSFILERTVVQTVGEVTTDVTFGSFDGTIVIQKGKQH